MTTTHATSPVPPVPVVGSFSSRLVTVTSPVNLVLRPLFVVCLYGALVHDAQMYGTWCTAFRPTAFLQGVFYLSCIANGWLAVTVPLGYPLLRYFGRTPCLSWGACKYYDVNGLVSLTLSVIILVDWLKARTQEVQDAGAVGVFLTHMASIACTYMAFQVATIYAVVWCAIDEPQPHVILPRWSQS